MFISANVSGNVHAAVAFVNSMPDNFAMHLFQVVYLDGTGCIVIFKVDNPNTRVRMREWLGLLPSIADSQPDHHDQV